VSTVQYAGRVNGNMSDLYESDILEWAEQQAELLRRLAAGERVNDQVDWPNRIDEVETVGRNELRTAKSHFIQALLHELRAEAWPLSRDVPHWRAEAGAQRGEAREAFTPSMRQRLHVDSLYREAVRRMADSIDGVAPLLVPETSPVKLDKLLAIPPERRSGCGRVAA
jgi:hypothetical protein